MNMAYVDNSLSDKHILITGASSGIGRETAVVLSNSGAKLLLNGRKIAELEKTQQMLAGQGHHIIPADLSEINDMSFLFDSIVQTGGKLDGMVYCAGIIPVTPLRSLSIVKIEEAMRINFYAFVDMVRCYVKQKYSNGGSIIGISSIASVKPEKGQTAYAATKAAMNTAIEVIAQEIAGKGIRINTVLPGVTRITSHDEAENEQTIYPVERQILGLINPADIGKMCRYLLSNEAKSITGRKFYIDGGLF